MFPFIARVLGLDRVMKVVELIIVGSERSNVLNTLQGRMNIDRALGFEFSVARQIVSQLDLRRESSAAVTDVQMDPEWITPHLGLVKVTY